MKLGIYCRISRLKDGNDLSIEDQKQKGEAKAKELGIPFEYYIDEGLSGASERIEDRPEFERFLGDVASKKITHVYACDQSRFERNPQIRFAITELFKKANVVYYTHMDGLVNLNDPQAEFFGDLLSVINKFHVTTTKLKVKSALLVRAKQGKSKGILPYGYTKDENSYIIIDPEEAEIVKRVYAMSLAGVGSPTIAETFQNEGIQTRFNKMGEGSFTIKNKWTGKATEIKKAEVQWAPNTVLNIIKNPFYKGERQYKDEVLPVPAIVTPEYWEKVNYNLQFNKNNTGKKVEYRYLLKGLLRCGICGRNMYGHKRENKHDNHYMCSSKRIKNENCGNRSINIDKIENFIWLNLFVNGELDRRIENEFRFDQSEVNRLNEQVKSLNGRIVTLGDERKRAIDLTIRGVISEADIAGNLADIEGQLKEINIIKDDVQNKLNALNYSNEIIKKYNSTFQQYTETATFEQKRNIVNNFISNIVVTYSKDSEDYLINIEYKIDIPNENVIAELNKKASRYYTVKKELDGEEHKVFRFELDADGNPKPIKFRWEDVEGNEEPVEWEVNVENIHINNESMTKKEFDELVEKVLNSKDDSDEDFEPTAGGDSNESPNESESKAERNSGFISPIIDNIIKFHREGITVTYPRIIERNERFISRWRQLSSAGRNFFGTQRRFVSGRTARIQKGSPGSNAPAFGR
jgi:site-specific DNA recombinase